MSGSQLMAKAKVLMREVFGFGEFRAGQEDVVTCLLEGRSALAVFPTGAGKSLCYQLPALLEEGVTLVISPLIALMKDQVDFLVGKGIAAARLDSSLGGEEVIQLEERLRRGGIKLLYLAPERLANERFCELIRGVDIAMLAVDEAHCISEWGHNFRPDYLKIAGVARKLGVRVLGLTATATEAVCADIRSEFGVLAADHYQTSFRRRNLYYGIRRCHGAERLALLAEMLQRKGGVPAIVYVTLQETAGRVAAHLRGEGMLARPYHAGLPEDCRTEVQDGFMRGEIPIVVATIAFGMGIDKGDIRSVIHYNLPKTLENYVQETGRAGRDGRPARCEMLACGDDLTVLENFIYGDTPSEVAVRNVIEGVLRQGDEVEISRYDLSIAHDMRPLVLGTALAHLEVAGILESRGVVHRQLKVKLGGDDEEIIAGYDEEEKAFLRRVLKSGKRGWRWLTLEPAAAALELSESEARIREAIADLAESGDITVEPSGKMERYRRRRIPESAGEIVAEVQGVFRRREASDLARLEAVVGYAASRGCLTRQLVSYFGEPMDEGCGNCSYCQGELGEGKFQRASGRELLDDELAAIHSLVGERHVALRTPRQLARFLCGITSPAATRARLTRDDRFGLLEEMAFVDVLAFVGEMNLA